MARQAVLVEMWRVRLGLDERRVRHVLLLPQRLSERAGRLTFPAVTWEQVLQEYDVVGPRYWAKVLTTALSRHEELESRREMRFRGNAEGVLTGAQVIEAHAAGTPPFDAVGRSGGLTGAKFLSDLSTGRWRTKTYEVRSGGPANRNWFSLTDFIASTARLPLH